MAAERSFVKPGATLADLMIAAVDRLDDAEAIFVAGRYASSIAMGIYSLEIHLKVGICKRLNLPHLPKAFEIHDLESLLILTGLQSAIDAAPQVVQDNWDDLVGESQRLADMRYTPMSLWPRTQAVSALQKLRDPSDGVLPWLSTQF